MANPALDYTINIQNIKDAAAFDSPDAFKTETLCMWVDAIDTQKVALIRARLTSASFTKYKPDDAKICLNIEELGTIIGEKGPMGDLTPTTPLTIRYGDTTKQIKFCAGGWVFTADGIDCTMVQKDPELIAALDAQPAVVIIPPAIFRKIVTSAERLNPRAGTIVLGVAKESQAFYAEALGEKGKFRYEMSTSGEFGVGVVDEARTEFSTDYLIGMANAMQTSRSVDISLGKEWPGKFAFPIAGGEGSVIYYLAPRLEQR
jgi:proliferating cell nuclear antigen